QKVLDLLRQIQKLKRAAFFADCGKARNEFADAARIDITDAREVQEDLVLAVAKQLTDLVAKRNASFSNGNFSFQIDYGYVAGLAFSDSDIRHFYLLKNFLAF